MTLALGTQLRYSDGMATKKTGPLAKDRAKVPHSRAVAGQFKPGQSGNPGGRRAVPPEVKELFAARSHDAALFIANLMDDTGADMKLRLDAAKTILDRHLGKPATQGGDVQNERLAAFFTALAGVPQ
jgi:hypothetical protein